MKNKTFKINSTTLFVYKASKIKNGDMESTNPTTTIMTLTVTGIAVGLKD